MERMRSAGAVCSGMSSFGPTVYAIGDLNLQKIELEARSCMSEYSGGTTLLTSARNKGASVRVV
jgi:beta-ribofuranosylaminobenzene 5'-phosphate synthase